MIGISQGIEPVPSGSGRQWLPTGGTSTAIELDAGCRCRSDRLSTVHVYLKRHFPHRAVRDLHSPTHTRLARADVLAGRGDYHVMSIATDAPSHAVLLRDFLEQPLADIEARLRQWDLAHALLVHRIVIVGSASVAAL